MKEREQDLKAFPHSNKAQPAQATRYEYKEKVSRKRHEYCHEQRVYDFPILGDGSVTAGNASGINDAAAAVVLMEASIHLEREPSQLSTFGQRLFLASAPVNRPTCPASRT